MERSYQYAIDIVTHYTLRNNSPRPQSSTMMTCVILSIDGMANSFIQFVLLLLLLLLLIMLNIVYTKIGTSITEKAFHFTFGTLYQPSSRHQLRSVGGFPASAYIGIPAKGQQTRAHTIRKTILACGRKL